jgi:hypothetical protein
MRDIEKPAEAGFSFKANIKPFFKFASYLKVLQRVSVIAAKSRPPPLLIRQFPLNGSNLPCRLLSLFPLNHANTWNDCYVVWQQKSNISGLEARKWPEGYMLGD